MTAQIEAAARQTLEPFDRGAKSGGSAEGPYQVQHDLQEMMQNLVGIVRREDEMVRALEGLGKLWERAGPPPSTAIANTIPAGTRRST